MMSKYKAYSDEQLASSLKRDDHHAFTEIYERYWKKMLLIAWNHSSQSAQAEDMVHEVFISLWERRATLEIQNISAYLATAIKFSVFKFHQREYRKSELLNKNYIFQDVHYEDAAMDALFLNEYINHIVEEMPEKCRLVFSFSRIDGLKNNEIAEKMNISEKGVEANLTRALKFIRNELKEHWMLYLILFHL
ncbi:RNA polymerase sigma-70 factor [Pedobacter sp. Du54]|uniref:RNA polymerase sigma-70 factor n=1 Tax=Pedobacter anseongensis TaxID=3133439 RepID=UPI00309B1504